MSLHHSFSSPRGIQLPANRASLVTVLDIGTSKVSCIIAKLKPIAGGSEIPGRSHSAEVIGIGHHLSRGVKAGVIVDIHACEQAVRSAIDMAERMAGMTVEHVIVNVSCGRIHSEAFSASVDVQGHEVGERDINRVLQAGMSHSSGNGRSVVHSLPIGFSLDQDKGVRDPRGMVGGRLGVDIHVVSAERAPLRNLSLCISRCHLKIDAFVVTPYASGLSSLVKDETDLGVTVVDMGAGTTSVGVFYDGYFAYSDVVALGGGHVTTDIARGLSAPMLEAERIKTLYGSALASQSDERELISVPLVGHDEAGDSVNQVPRSMLTGIIKPRLEETLELVRDRLNASGFARYAGKRLVLIGGACQLTGARELAQRVLGTQARIGRPIGVVGLPESARGPAFAAVCGLLVYPQVNEHEAGATHDASFSLAASGTYLAKVGHWIRESF